jgi:hypothetical protein
MIGKGIWGPQPGSSAKKKSVVKAAKVETPPEAKEEKTAKKSSKAESKDSGKE